MNRPFIIAVLVLLPLAAFSQMNASATQTIQLEIRSIAALEVSGDPQPMRITTGTAGTGPLAPAEESSTFYRLTTNATNMKLSVAIDEPVPSGTRLYVEMGAETGTSAGKIEISNAISSVDAVTGISRGWADAQSIRYSFEADAGTQAFAAQSRTIILTLTN